MSDKTDNIPTTDETGQKNCWCESLACEGIHPMGNCPVKVDNSFPTMVYVGKICLSCAIRIKENNGESYIKSWGRFA